MDPFLTVVVPVYNEEERLERCLRSVLNQSVEKQLELICVDDGSTDRTSEILSRYERRDRKMRVITHEQNVGYASTISDGLSQAEGSVVAFLDADSFLEQGSVSALISAFEEGADAVFGRVEVGNPEDGLHPMACKVGKQFNEDLNFGGALMAFDHSVLLSEGGFELTAERAGQDVEIRERLLSEGYNVVLDDSIVVYSDFPVNLSDVFKRKYLSGKTYILTYYNNPDGFDPAVLRGFGFFLAFDAALLLSLFEASFLPVVFAMLFIFLAFYKRKTQAMYRTSNGLGYVPAYLVYQFIGGQLRMVGYLSEIHKFLFLIRYHIPI